MKTAFFILFIAIIFPVISFSQISWTSQNSGTNYPLDGVYFVDENNGWVSGWIGIILHTTDGGQTWNLQNAPANYPLYSVFFTDLQNGWAAGYGGKVVHTTDGGENWIAQDISSYNDIYKLFFIDGNTGWAAGGDYDPQTGIYQRAIYNTTNGGTDWNLQYGAAYESQLHSIYFTDSNTGYAAGEQGIIMKTTNGGNNWFEQQNITSFNFGDIFFSNSTTGFVVGEYLGVPHYSVIFRTTDSGESWNEISLGTNEILTGIYFTGELKGYAVGNDWGSGNIAVIYHTTDGGINWVKQNLPAYDALSGVFFINETKGWAVGTLGTILTADNPIPVEFASFTAAVENNSVTLNWKTATEANNSGFEIDRKKSEAGSQKSEWKKIGFQIGNGTSTNEKLYSYIDRNLEPGDYSYRLVQIDFDGTRNESKVVNVEINSLPTDYSLFQNYPNPFNPSTAIEYAIPKNGNVTLKIYNTLGEEVKVILNKFQSAGRYKINFYADKLSSGIYYYRINSENYTSTKKMLLLR